MNNIEGLNAVIIDDEKLARKSLAVLLEKYPEIHIAAECTNGFEGVKAINELKPDLVFLDIQMPKLTGFELLELLDHKPVIIFVTAYDEFALKAFEVNAADYLLKPVSDERFAEAMEKVLRLSVSDAASKTDSVRTYTQKEKPLERIVVREKGRIIIIPVERVIYLEAQDDYVKITSAEGTYLKKKTMKSFEDGLPAGRFVRIHRSYIAAVNQIQRIELYEKETYRLKLKDGSTLPVSKQGYERLKEILDM